ncbi:hypothetical protein [Candidatus Synchoanobacter obligatus]|uniref:Uncharacterized protein n=1 Tax=Candidatus Synchoanobacter obligatus TaxID=2919597 RepID=A0ABT1L655_9GAMM|nr:hypothetical protein [Candidatus Synchoanobacter obligatus]MCP8352664.1 hypothetical protein [Candidatus Synchoanobacter obligatus]
MLLHKHVSSESIKQQADDPISPIGDAHDAAAANTSTFEEKPSDLTSHLSLPVLNQPCSLIQSNRDSGFHFNRVFIFDDAPNKGTLILAFHNPGIESTTTKHHISQLEGCLSQIRELPDFLATEYHNTDGNITSYLTTIFPANPSPDALDLEASIPGNYTVYFKLPHRRHQIIEAFFSKHASIVSYSKRALDAITNTPIGAGSLDVDIRRMVYPDNAMDRFKTAFMPDGSPQGLFFAHQRQINIASCPNASHALIFSKDNKITIIEQTFFIRSVPKQLTFVPVTASTSHHHKTFDHVLSIIPADATNTMHYIYPASENDTSILPHNYLFYQNNQIFLTSTVPIEGRIAIQNDPRWYYAFTQDKRILFLDITTVDTLSLDALKEKHESDARKYHASKGNLSQCFWHDTGGIHDKHTAVSNTQYQERVGRGIADHLGLEAPTRILPHTLLTVFQLNNQKISHERTLLQTPKPRLLTFHNGLPLPPEISKIPNTIDPLIEQCIQNFNNPPKSISALYLCLAIILLSTSIPLFITKEFIAASIILVLALCAFILYRSNWLNYVIPSIKPFRIATPTPPEPHANMRYHPYEAQNDPDNTFAYQGF